MDVAQRVVGVLVGPGEHVRHTPAVAEDLDPAGHPRHGELAEPLGGRQQPRLLDELKVKS